MEAQHPQRSSPIWARQLGPARGPLRVPAIGQEVPPLSPLVLIDLLRAGLASHLSTCLSKALHSLYHFLE